VLIDEGFQDSGKLLLLTAREPALAIDGVRHTSTDGASYWRDEHGLSSWLQVDFNGSKSIDEDRPDKDSGGSRSRSSIRAGPETRR